MENQKQVWENIASKWNEFRTVISPTAKKFILEQKGEILDLGCGSGRNFLKINGLNWHAIDFSEKMIKFAKVKAKKIGIPIDLQVANSTSLPYKDNYFDSVICFAVLHCIESGKERKKTLEEIYRILKPSGTALISSWGPKSPRLKNKEKECLIPWTTKEKTKFERYTYVYDLNELIKLCKKVGFEIVNSFEERNVNVIVRKPKSLSEKQSHA